MTQRQIKRASSLLLLLLSLLAPWAYGDDNAADFRVLSATASDVAGVVRLDASFSLNFGTTLEEALRNGVELPLLVEIEALRQRDYLWSDTIAHVEQRYHLSFNALTAQYQLHNLNTDAQFRLPNLEAIMVVLGTLNKFPFLDRSLLIDDVNYAVRVRIAIERDQLPTPVRLMSYVTSDWAPRSEWYQWPLILR
jgi:Domain of unknown function (DUF4390)